MNDDTVQNQGRQSLLQPLENPDRLKVGGKALRVNENSVEEHGSSPLPPPPQEHSSDLPKQHKVEGKALRVNENSVDGQETARPSAAPPHRD